MKAILKVFTKAYKGCCKKYKEAKIKIRKLQTTKKTERFFVSKPANTMCTQFLEIHSLWSKGPFTWKEGNPLTRVTLLQGLPFSIVFPGFVYMRGGVTLGGGLPYLLARVTLLEGTTFCLFKPCKRSRLGYPLKRDKSSGIGLLSQNIITNGFARL